jgi:hypothetical protein
MEAISLGGKQLILGLRWETAGERGGLKDDVVFDRWNSNHGVRIHSERMAVGLVKDARNGGFFKEKSYSLGAFLAQYNQNCLIVFEFPDINGRTIYWSCLVNSGAVEMDVVGTDLSSTIAPAIRRLNDPVVGVLNGENPPLITNIDSGIEAILELRNFQVEPMLVSELDTEISAEKISANLLIKDLNFNLVAIISTLWAERKKELGVGVLAIVLGLVGMDFLSEDKRVEIDVLFNDQLASYKKALAPKKTLDISGITVEEVENAAAVVLRERLRGAKIAWVYWAIKTFQELPHYAHGYSKKSFECTSKSGYCVATYSADGGYMDFEKGMIEARTHLEDIKFTPDGVKINGKAMIPGEYLFNSPVKFDMLPPFDDGESLISPVSKITSVRAGLTLSIQGASLEEVSFTRKEFNEVKGVEKSFWYLGWTATGKYLHQLDSASRAIKRNFLTIEKLTLKRDNGTSFKLSGGYFMRHKEGK